MKKWKLAIVVIPVIILVSYIAYQRGFEAGRDYTAQTDSTAPKRWVNKKWGYEITFPGQWDAIKRGDVTIKSPGADVFCSSRAGASTAVFLYPLMSGDTLDSLTDEVINGHKEVGKVTILEKNDYTKDGARYRRIIFQFGAGSDNTTYYAIIFSKNISLLVSSTCLTKIFESCKKDFESIVESIKFF